MVAGSGFGRRLGDGRGSGVIGLWAGRLRLAGAGTGEIFVAAGLARGFVAACAGFFASPFALWPAFSLVPDFAVFCGARRTRLAVFCFLSRAPFPVRFAISTLQHQKRRAS